MFSENREFTAEDMPVDPMPGYGFTFTGWDKSVDEIKTALNNGENITVTAQFKVTEVTFSVTIYNGEATTATPKEYQKATWISATAKAVSGKTFAYWTLNGDLLTYNTKAYFKATSDSVLRAVYSESEVEAVGTAVINSAKYNTSSNQLTFVSYMTVPEGAEILAAGLVAASPTISNKYDPSEELTLENADYPKSSPKAAGLTGSFTYTWNKTSVMPSAIWYARSYVRYTYQGRETIVYSDRMTVRAGDDYDRSEKGTAVINDYTYNEASKQLSFVSYLTAPDGGTIKKAGLVASNSTFDPTAAVLTAENAQFAKSSAKAEGRTGSFTYTWNKTKVEKDDVWYVRAYLVYTDAENVDHTIYGTLKTVTAGKNDQ
jgi:hypothetical protein